MRPACQFLTVERDEINIVQIERRETTVAGYVGDDPPHERENHTGAFDHQEGMHLLLGYTLDMENADIFELEDEQRLTGRLDLRGNLEFRNDIILMLGWPFLGVQTDFNIHVGLNLALKSLVSDDVLKRQIADELAESIHLNLRHLGLGGILRGGGVVGHAKLLTIFQIALSITGRASGLNRSSDLSRTTRTNYVNAMDNMIPAWLNGNLQPVEKLSAHLTGLRHQAVSVFVAVGGKILIQRRAQGKYHTPGLWANTCCTHPHWKEDPRACAVRRLREELGITGLEPVWKDRIEYRADVGGGMTEHEVVDLFLAEADQRPTVIPEPSEVCETRWIGLDELAQEIAANPAAFTPWLRIYMEHHRDSVFGPS